MAGEKLWYFITNVNSPSPVVFNAKLGNIALDAVASEHYPDFDSKRDQKRAKTPLSTGISALPDFHKYVVYQLIFCFLPKYFLSPPDEVFFS